jgi:NAD(P)-dependent dehydrogenase (short-subunit alcohol dehydrogenase family)
MTDNNSQQVWLVTGAGRGMGVDIAQAALAAGHLVVATGRNPEGVAQAVGESATCSRSGWTSPTRPTRWRRYGPRWRGSAGSTCW